MSLIEEITLWVGIDWADKKNVFALRKPGAGRVCTGTFLQSTNGIDEWVSSLRKLSNGRKVAVALEQAKGGLIFSLMKYDFLVLYPVHPTTLAKYRETWRSSGAKDDPSDAALILELLESHHKKLTVLTPEPEEVRLLQRLTEQRTRLVNDLKRIGNKLTSTLKEYFPEVLEMFPRIYRDIVADFVLAYPTLEASKLASDQELLNFFRTHTAGNSKLATRRIALLRDATGLIKDRAVINSNALFVQALARELKALNNSIARYDEEIEKTYNTLPDKELYDSLPSAGEVSAPRLLAAMGVNRSKFLSADEVARFMGIAPVVERSGNQCWTHWRFQCNKVLRQAFIDWAFLSVRTSFWAEAYYRKQRQKNKNHSVAVRALAYKWIRIIFKMWKDKTPYSEAHYLKALKASGSPLIHEYTA